MKKKKRRTQIKRCDNETTQIKRCVSETIINESRVVTTDGVDDPHLSRLPDEVIMENIVTGVPVRDLVHFSCVSKLWYNSIYNDSQIVSSHFEKSKNNPFFIFILLNSRCLEYGLKLKFLKHSYVSIDLEDDHGGHYYPIRLNKDVLIQDDNNNDLRFRNMSSFYGFGEVVLVGCCNGLACFTQSCRGSCDAWSCDAFLVQNPCRSQELLCIKCRYQSEYINVCYGFGFDPLTNEYKVVTVLCNSEVGNDSNNCKDQSFKCMVYTLGTSSWRETISGPCAAACPPRGIRMSRINFAKPAIFVGGALFWRIFTRGGNGVDNDSETEMLLLFDLHDENFQFVHIPAECASTTTTESKKIVDHLLVFKGSPCIVVFEKILMTSDYCLHHILHHQRQQQQRNIPLYCCCCCKIHLYVLKDIVKQVWIKETNDVSMATFSSSSLFSPANSRCCCLDTTITPPTRVMSFCDRVFLYWFDGKCLRLYDTCSKHLKVVKYSSNDKVRLTFENKMKEPLFPDSVENHAKTDNNIYCRDLDFHLSTVVENFVSLRAFLPKGATKKEYVEVLSSQCTGYVVLNNSHKGIYAF